MANNKHDTREGWLKSAAKALDQEFFGGNGYELPEKLAFSCGFPRGHANAIGQCWDPQVSADGTTHIFICPTQAEPIRVLDILLHELIHACVGIECGHKGAFRKMAQEFGLEGKMTATVVTEGSELWRRLSTIAQELGPYPHTVMQKVKKTGKKTNGWVRYKSPVNEDFKVMVSPRMVEEYGAPLDPEGNEMEPVQ